MSFPTRQIVRSKTRIAQQYWEQTSPVQDTWYEIFDIDKLLELFILEVVQENDETDTKNMNLRLTVDGDVLELKHGMGNETFTHSQNYFIYLTDESGGSGVPRITKMWKSQTEEILGAVKTASTYGTIFEFSRMGGASIKLEVKLESAPGTNQIIRCYYGHGYKAV